MRYSCFAVVFTVLTAMLVALAPTPSPTYGQDKKDDDKAKVVHPVALLTFEERGTGAKDLGPKVVDLLFAKLAAKPDFYLVDRTDLK
jgi:hypothetical protein